MAGGHGTGVTRLRNTNIVLGATFNGDLFANDAAHAIGANNTFENFVNSTPTFTSSSGGSKSRNSNSSTLIRELTPGIPIVPRSRQDLPGVRQALDNPQRFAIANHQGTGNFVVDLEGGGVRFVTGETVLPIDTQIKIAQNAADAAATEAMALNLSQEVLITLSPYHETRRDFEIAAFGIDPYTLRRVSADDRRAAVVFLVLPGGNSGQKGLADDTLDAINRFHRSGLSPEEIRLFQLQDIKAGRNINSNPTLNITPRNVHLAGKPHPVTKIPFNQQGFPDFSGVSRAEVKIVQTGNRRVDSAAANKAANLSDTPERFIWHHHQDGRTMQLVPETIHQQTGHTGGVAIIKQTSE